MIGETETTSSTSSDKSLSENNDSVLLGTSTVSMESRLPLVNISCIPDEPLVWTLNVPRRNKGTTHHNKVLMKFIYSNGFITQYSNADSNRQKQKIVDELLAEITKRGYIETYNPVQGQPNERLNPEGLKSNLNLINRLRTLIANKAAYSKRKNKKADESDERLRNNHTSKRNVSEVQEDVVVEEGTAKSRNTKRMKSWNTKRMNSSPSTTNDIEIPHPLEVINSPSMKPIESSKSNTDDINILPPAPLIHSALNESSKSSSSVIEINGVNSSSIETPKVVLRTAFLSRNKKRMKSRITKRVNPSPSTTNDIEILHPLVVINSPSMKPIESSKSNTDDINILPPAPLIHSVSPSQRFNDVTISKKLRNKSSKVPIMEIRDDFDGLHDSFIQTINGQLSRDLIFPHDDPLIRNKVLNLLRSKKYILGFKVTAEFNFVYDSKGFFVCPDTNRCMDEVNHPFITVPQYSIEALKGDASKSVDNYVRDTVVDVCICLLRRYVRCSKIKYGATDSHIANHLRMF